ncbi:MAG TPA: DUF2326 domain-containing protein [Chloroflexota bacterium]|nr:DUF2326 domain-containing protein [Chloroflexota bacterium]HUM67280.1 DUF2326 domain-containing protein [Chloroflexota bacterium]
MIHAVRADQPTFKAVRFEPGFNVILAERTKESTKKDSRNGLGKTTLIKIIHFCLGANTSPGKDLRREPLDGWTFYIDIDLRGLFYTVARNTSNPGRITITGDYSGWPIQPHIDSDTHEASLSLRDWNAVLGWLMFDLPVSNEEKYRPTFRSLINYFIREGRDAFSTPFEHYRKQQVWDKQVNNTFLLNLGWEQAQWWQVLKDREKAIQQLKDVSKSGLMPNLMGSIGDLEAERVRQAEQVARTQEQLNSFRVHPQYQEIEERANVLTALIHQFSNENLQDRRMVGFYQSGLANERPASEEAVLSLYEEAGVALPNNVVKRLTDVQEFHRKITADRRAFLEREIQRLQDDLVERSEKVRAATNERASLLQILQTHGALAEYTTLQQRHIQIMTGLEEVKTRIDNLRKFEREKSNLKIEKERLLVEAQSDYEERQEIRQRAISLFNANSETLYKAPGRLIINVDATGYKFQVEIERSTSQGVEQMKVFSYDLMLAQLWSERDFGPGFLIHDSTIFDGVDERQVAQALQLAAHESELRGFQYICCLNSDLIPEDDFDEGFDLYAYKRLELTDASEDGGLLGIRF